MVLDRKFFLYTKSANSKKLQPSDEVNGRRERADADGK